MIRRILVLSIVAVSASACSQKSNTKHTQSSQNPWVIRTDFSDGNKWERIRGLIRAPQRDSLTHTDYFAYVEFVNDQKNRDKEPFKIVVSLPDDHPGMFCFIVDRECIENPEHPVLVVGFYPSDNTSFNRVPRDTPRSDIATFRAIPSQIQSIENNLSIANVDFEEFAIGVESDGVFRGFHQDEKSP